MQHRTLRSIYISFFLLIGILLISTKSYAQKEPQYTQYMYNIGSFNPGYVGTCRPLSFPDFIVRNG